MRNQISKIKEQKYNSKFKNIFEFLSVILLFAFLFLLFAPKALAIVNGPPSPQPPYAENQVIVKFKEGQGPEQLKQAFLQRLAKREKFPLGFFLVLFEDIRLRLAKEENPGVKFSRLQNVEKEAGVIEKEKLFQSEEASLQNFYLLKTDGRLGVLETVALYQSLPEVEFAEPNYIYSIMGI